MSAPASRYRSARSMAASIPSTAQITHAPSLYQPGYR